MDRDALLPRGRSAVVIVVVGLVAVTFNLIFARTLHLEPVGVLGFGLFCLGYGAIVASRSRSQEQEASAVGKRHFPPREEYGSRVGRNPGPQRFDLPRVAARPCHALTIDLEDYFHTEVASQGVSFTDWEQQPSRIEASTHRLIDLLEHNQTRATFFVLGWVAKRYPWLVREIHQRGHEVGCHSLDHRLVCRMKAAEFEATTRQAKDLIESIVQEPVLGYRAPCFSITPGCEWAFDSLAELGFTYDSSVHPVRHPLYGNPNAPRGAYSVAEGRLLEIPIATWKIAGRNLSVGGGAYLRLLPYQYIHRGLVAWEKQMQTPAMLYLHPWEIDPYQPYIRLPLQSKIRQTWGTTTMETKLQRLLAHFSFAPVREVHRHVLEHKGAQAAKRAFEQADTVAQVAG